MTTAETTHSKTRCPKLRTATRYLLNSLTNGSRFPLGRAPAPVRMRAALPLLDRQADGLERQIESQAAVLPRDDLQQE